MIENPIVETIVNICLLTLVTLIPLASYRVWRGRTAADRLIGVDIITTLLVGIAVVLAIVENTDTTIDMGIVLAALAFAATISIARYISEGRVF